MSNLSELKGILTALGGTPAASDTNDETIAKIKAVITAHGGLGNVLPSTSSSDNGKKVLGVSGGKWAKVDIPTGVPAFTAAQNGKVLGVVDGALAWVDKT